MNNCELCGHEHISLKRCGVVLLADDVMIEQECECDGK